MEFLMGMAGAMVAIGLFVFGFYAGWRLRGKAERTQPAEVPQEAEQERKRLLEQQRAFQQLIHYNSGVAYGMERSGGDEQT